MGLPNISPSPAPTLDVAIGVMRVTGGEPFSTISPVSTVLTRPPFWIRSASRYTRGLPCSPPISWNATSRSLGRVTGLLLGSTHAPPDPGVLSSHVHEKRNSPSSASGSYDASAESSTTLSSPIVPEPPPMMATRGEATTVTEKNFESHTR